MTTFSIFFSRFPRTLAGAFCAGLFMTCATSACATSDDSGSGDDDLRGADSGYFMADKEGAAFRVLRLGQLRARCANGDTSSNLCPITSFDFSKLALSATAQRDILDGIGVDTNKTTVLFKGTIAKRSASDATPIFRVLEVWRAPSTTRLVGDYYAISDRCWSRTGSTCNSLRGEKLNSTAVTEFSNLSFASAPGSAADKEAALLAVYEGPGLLVLGFAPQQGETDFLVQQYFLSVARAN